MSAKIKREKCGEKQWRVMLMLSEVNVDGEVCYAPMAGAPVRMRVK